MIYITPDDLWEKFEANKTSLEGHYLTCAETDGTGAIRLSTDEGELLLLYDDYVSGQTQYENFADEESAVLAYLEMLAWLGEVEDATEYAQEEDDPDDPEISDQLLAATAAWLCVATHCKPQDLNMTTFEIEDFAVNMLWELGIKEGEALD